MSTTTTTTATPTSTPSIITQSSYQWRLNNLLSYVCEGAVLFGVVGSGDVSAGSLYLVRKTAERLGAEPTNRAFDFVTIPQVLSHITLVQQLGQTLFTADEGGHKGVYHLDWNYKRIRKLLIPESFGDFESLVFYSSTLHVFNQGHWLSLTYDLNSFKKSQKSPKALRNGIRRGTRTSSDEESAICDEESAICDSDHDSDSESEPLTISPIRSPPKYGRQRARSSFGSFSESLSQSTLSDDISVCEHVSEKSGLLSCSKESLQQPCLTLYADPPTCEVGDLVVDLVTGTVTTSTGTTREASFGLSVL